MNARSKQGISRNRLARWIALFVLPVGLALGVVDTASAGPPCWAPAHGHRAHQSERHGRCQWKRSHKRYRGHHRGHRVRERHVYHHQVPADYGRYEAAEPYVEPASTNVTIALGGGSTPVGSGTVGAVVGAALGGYLGSNVGGGNGQLAATAAGTLAGWLVGGEIGRTGP